MYSTRYSCQILVKLELIRQIFEKYSNVKFNENTFIGSRIVLYGRTDRETDRQTDRQTDMMKLTVAFRKLAISA